MVEGCTGSVRVRGGAQPQGPWGCSGKLRGAVPPWPLVSLPLPGSWALLPWFCTQVRARLSTLHSLVPRTCGEALRPPSPEGQSFHLSPHSCPWSALGDQPSLPLSGCTWPSGLLGATEQKGFILSSELPFGGRHFSPGPKLSVDRQAEAAKPGQAPGRDRITRSGPLGPAHLCSVRVVGDGTAPRGGVAACHSSQAWGGLRSSSGGAACSWCPGKPVLRAESRGILECSIWAISVV